MDGKSAAGMRNRPNRELVIQLNGVQARYEVSRDRRTLGDWLRIHVISVHSTSRNTSKTVEIAKPFASVGRVT